MECELTKVKQKNAQQFLKTLTFVFQIPNYSFLLCLSPLLGIFPQCLKYTVAYEKWSLSALKMCFGKCSGKDFHIEV